jgi:hypothetical protein
MHNNAYRMTGHENSRKNLLLVAVHVQTGNRKRRHCRQSHFNPGKALPRTVRIFDRVTWGCDIGCEIPFKVCHGVGRITLYRAVDSENIKIKFIN